MWLYKYWDITENHSKIYLHYENGNIAQYYIAIIYQLFICYCYLCIHKCVCVGSDIVITAIPTISIHTYIPTNVSMCMFICIYILSLLIRVLLGIFNISYQWYVSYTPHHRVLIHLKDLTANVCTSSHKVLKVNCECQLNPYKSVVTWFLCGKETSWIPPALICTIS